MWGWILTEPTVVSGITRVSGVNSRMKCLIWKTWGRHVLAYLLGMVAESYEKTRRRQASARIPVQPWSLVGLVLNENQSAVDKNFPETGFLLSKEINRNNSRHSVWLRPFLNKLSLFPWRGRENVIGGQEARFETPVVARIDAEVCICICFYKWHGDFSKNSPYLEAPSSLLNLPKYPSGPDLVKGWVRLDGNKTHRICNRPTADHFWARDPRPPFAARLSAHLLHRKNPLCRRRSSVPGLLSHRFPQSGLRIWRKCPALRKLWHRLQLSRPNWQPGLQGTASISLSWLPSFSRRRVSSSRREREATPVSGLPHILEY